MRCGRKRTCCARRATWRGCGSPAQGDRAATAGEPSAHRELGLILLIQGHPKEALEKFMTARQLAAGTDPVDLIDCEHRHRIAGERSVSRGDRAGAAGDRRIPTRQRAHRRRPWLALIAAESANGQDAEARADLQKFLSTPRTWRTMAEIQKFPYFAANPKLLDGLRRAGMPAE